MSDLKRLTLAGIQNVPNLITQLPNALIMTPVAEKLDVFELCCKDIEAMAKTLFEAHQNGLVHGDIRGPNLFKTKEGGVLINDWGVAVEVNSQVDPNCFAGAVVEGSNEILEKLMKGEVIDPKPSNDLHALARTIFRKLYSPPQMKSLSKQPYNYRCIQMFWSLTSSAWQNIFKLADEAKVSDKQSYSKFAKALSYQLLI